MGNLYDPLYLRVMRVAVCCVPRLHWCNLRTEQCPVRVLLMFNYTKISDMKIKTIILCGIMSLIGFSAVAQKVEGVVRDATTNEALIGASIYWLNTNVGVATDIDGKYDLHRVKGYDKLVATYVGYSNDTIQVAQGVRLCSISSRIDFSYAF